MINIKSRIDFLNENDGFVEGLDYDLSFFKKAYRWVGQPGLFLYFYGKTKDMMDHVIHTGEEVTGLPNRIDLMETSYEGGIPMSVDPGYIGEPGNGDAIIRLVFNLELLLEDLGIDKFKNLLTNGEAEFRIMENVKNWTKYLIKIDVDEEFYNEIAEDEFSEYNPMKNWIPKDIEIDIFSDNPYDRMEPNFGPQISKKMLNKYTGKEYIEKLRNEDKI